MRFGSARGSNLIATTSLSHTHGVHYVIRAHRINSQVSARDQEVVQRCFSGSMSQSCTPTNDIQYLFYVHRVNHQVSSRDEKLRAKTSQERGHVPFAQSIPGVWTKEESSCARSGGSGCLEFASGSAPVSYAADWIDPCKYSGARRFISLRIHPELT